MALNYPELAKTAERMISQNGQTVSFVRNSRSAGNPSQPWRGPGNTTPETIAAIAVVIPNVEKDDKEAMKRGDATAYVAALPFGNGSPFQEAAMEGFDTMTDAGGTIWRVFSVDIINPGGIRILYDIQLLH